MKLLSCAILFILLVQAGIDGVGQDPERVLWMTTEGVVNPDEHHICFAIGFAG